MKNIKKIISVIPLLLAALVLYGALTGKIAVYIDNAKKHMQEAGQEKQNAEKGTYPPGKITSLKEAFEWDADYMMPDVDEYDPDNKIPGGVYGVTKDEWDYGEEYRNYEKSYDAGHPLEERYRGFGKYNPDRLVDVGEEFDIKSELITCRVESIEIKDNIDIKNIDRKYVDPDSRKYVLPYIDDSGKMDVGTLYYDNGGGEAGNDNIKFVSAHLSVTGHSEWVQESYAFCPGISILNDYGDLLENEPNLVRGSKDELTALGIYSRFYIDWEFIDFDKYPGLVIYSYPIRKGETMEFDAIFTVPEVYIDKAYLSYFGSVGYIESDNSYNFQDCAFIKIKS